MNASDHSDRNSPSAQASLWFSKARLGTLTPEEHREFQAWLASDPVHQQEYRSLQSVWQLADHLPLDEMRAIMERTDGDRPWPRRRIVVGAGAVCASAIVAGVTTRHVWLPSPIFSQRLATAKGERRQFDLPDGSVIDLNTDSDVSVAFHAGLRIAELHHGEALFSISADKARPFSVEAGDAAVLVTGTQFNVRREQDRVMVAVKEGSVEFSAGPWWRRKHATLTAGQVSLASRADGLVPPYLDRVEAITAWQRGRLVFRDVPLADVAVELNRYLYQPLRIADVALERLRVSGTLSIEAPDAALDILPEIAPVRVVRHPGRGAVVVAR